MAISYDDWKKQYEGMTTEQQKNYANKVKGNATATEYANRYIQEKQNAGSFGTQTANSYTNTNQSTNTQQGYNISSDFNKLSKDNGLLDQNLTAQGAGTWSQETVDKWNKAAIEHNQAVEEFKRKQDQGGSTLSDGNNGDGNTYGKFTFDANEFLDESKFGTGTGVKVQEGTAKDTGRPDYQIESDARLNEMVNNLNTYRQTNPEFFSSREEFNKQFEYNQRKSEAQRALLDSYWKKAQDYKKASSYNNSASFTSDLDSGNVSESEFEALKQYNQDVYIKWQKEMQDKLDAAIANLANPFSIDDMTTALNKIVEKFNLQAGDPYDIIGGWNQMMEKTGAWDSMKQAQQHFTAADDAIAQIKRIQSNYSSSTGGNQSDALVAARLQKATLPYETLLANELSAGQHWQSLYQTQLGTANNYANTINMQAQEDQRIFNNKIKALGFAMEAYSYRTPEQQAQLQLQTQSIQNDMSLLQQSKLNDLSLYNKYATGMMEAQLEYDLTDLNTTNEKQLKTNLKNVLDKYYDEYGDIIQRPKQQVIDDVLKLAKESGMSVAEALKANFIQPLQNKDEYVQAVADKYGMNPTQSIQNIGDRVALVTKYPNGKMSYQILDDVYNPKYDLKTINGKAYMVVDDGSGIPQLKYIGGDGTVLNYASLNQGLQSFMSKYEDGTFYKEKGCGYFCNEYLTSIGDAGHVGSTWESKKALCSNKDWKNMVVGSIVAIDSGATYTNDKGEKVNAGHVSIVAGYDPATGKVLLYDANRDGKGNVLYHETTVDKLYGYYTPESYKNAGSTLPDYVENLNEYGFVDTMTGIYGSYLMGEMKQGRVNQLGGDDLLQKQAAAWLDWLSKKGVNEKGYKDGAEELYEKYLASNKQTLPSTAVLKQFGGVDQFIAQATAFGQANGYGRYTQLNDKGYYDDLVPLYNEFYKTGNAPTEDKVADYGGLDNFYNTFKAYRENNGYYYTPEEQDKEIADMRDKWETTQVNKEMIDSIDALGKIQTMLRNGTSGYGDYTAVYLLNKLRDPDSVVREQEFSNTKNIGSIWDRINNYFQQIDSGKILNDSQKTQIYNEMNTLMNAKIEAYNNQLRAYRQKAIKGGDTSKIGNIYKISKKGNVSFGNLTGDITEPPHSDELN